MKFFVTISVLIFLLNAVLFAQEQTEDVQDSTATFLGKNVKVTGELGAYGELYFMNGQPERRPKSAGRIYFRPTLSLFNLINIPFEFLLSTEGSSAKQNINQFGINPSWKWGSVHLGDFSQEYSQYTLSGILIRGVGLELKPGIFRFSAVSGFTQRSVPGGAQDGSFKRFLIASKIGIGKEESSFVDFIFLKAKDEISSLAPDSKSINIIAPNGDDILEIGSLQSIKWNSYGVAGAIKIEISRDGGNTYELIADNIPNVNFYNWTVTGPTTFQAILKVSSSDDVTVYDKSDYIFTIGSGVQSIIVNHNDLIVNPNSITPQENLLIGTKGRIEFLENTLSLEFDGAGSVYTRDLRASLVDLDSSDVPSFFSNIYKIRVGSNYDFAVNTLLNFNLSSFNSKIGFKRTGPGYNSLGTGYLINDVMEYSIMNSFRIATTGFMIGYIRQSDNLLDQKLYTTGRNIVTAAVSSMIIERWNASLNLNYLDMSNDATSDSLKTKFASYVLSTNHSFLLSQDRFFRNINFNYSFQNSNNTSYLLKNNKTSVHTINFGLGFNLLNNLNSTFTAGFINSTSMDTVKNFIQNYSLTLQHNLLQNRFVNSLNFTTAINENNRTLRLTFNSLYQLTNSDRFALLISVMNFDGTNNIGDKFTESMVSLNYSHYF